MQRITILVKGQIGKQWSDWFGALEISQPNPGETTLTGLIQDQAALYGVIARLRDLGLQLCRVISEEVEEEADETAQ